MATTYKARALRYARSIIARNCLKSGETLTNVELNLRAAARLNPSLIALARVNIQRERARLQVTAI